MKKLIICTFVTFTLFFIHSTIKAQGFNAGIVAGLNSSQVSGDDLSGFNKPSPILGLFVERKFSENWSAQMEITYMGKGSRKNIDTTRNDFTLYRLNMHYTEIPVMIKFHFSPKLIFEAGPSIGYLITHREADEFGDLVGQIEPREQFNRIDFSAAAGIYYGITDRLFFNLRVVNSVLPVRDHDGNTKFRLNRGQYHSGLGFRFQYQL